MYTYAMPQLIFNISLKIEKSMKKMPNQKLFKIFYKNVNSNLLTINFHIKIWIPKKKSKSTLSKMFVEGY